jgi:hypothetical protein
MSYVDTSQLKNSTIMLLYSERDEIKLDPPYQRMGGVWTIEKRRLLIDSILNDYDIPKIYFHQYSNEAVSETGFRYAVIDGRQRLETIWQFMDGDFTLSRDFEYQRDPSLDLGGLSYQDIAQKHPKIRIKFDSFNLPVVTVSIDGDDIDLIEDMFSRLNEAVPLNAAEKRNAIGGNMVRAITTLSNHEFFQRCVRFSNTRYQHREVSSRMLLAEDSLLTVGKLIDTKKVYLDALARRYHQENHQTVVASENTVRDVLDVMTDVFTTMDDLLLSQGIMVVYYLIFKFADANGEIDKVSRRALLDFRTELAANRELAVRDYAESSFELLEFDRLNQQGTNDASSIRERYAILARFLGLSHTDVP